MLSRQIISGQYVSQEQVKHDFDNLNILLGERDYRDLIYNQIIILI